MIGLLPTAALVGLAQWRLRTRPLTAFHACALALGLALAAMIVGVGSTYAFPLLEPLQASNALIAGPLFVYVCTASVARTKFSVGHGPLIVWGALGLVPLWFISSYAWLLTACGFGDCA